MRTHAAAVAILLSLVGAQTNSRVSSVRPVTTGDVQPSQTVSSSGPVNTQSACRDIRNLIGSSRLEFPSVGAELAYACLQTVPFSKTNAQKTITSLKNLLQYQSTLSYIKSPPKGYANEGVDIPAGLDTISQKVDNNGYNNEYDFEADISVLFNKAHDGHLAFDGMAYGGVFRWARSAQVALISATNDGNTPKIWTIQDFNKTGQSFTPSAVTQINGKPVMDLLLDEASRRPYHDPDTRFNQMFYLQPAESYGSFRNPKFYPGPNTTLTFENGTTNTYPNFAVILDRDDWTYISDGRSFYQTFITPSTTNSKIKKRIEEEVRIPHQLRHHKSPELSRRYVQQAYPEPFITHSADDVALTGYFMKSSLGDIGILSIATFNTESNKDAQQFQMVIQVYIAEAVKRDVKKIIVDIRTNGGGLVLLGYDTYKQFFPAQSDYPQLQSRYRAHQGSQLTGQKLSTLKFSNAEGELYVSPFNYHSYLDKDLKAFRDFNSLYGPNTFNNDKFTNLLRYNLTDDLVTSSDRYSVGITVTGYNSRKNFTTPPFSADNIVILSDGICASTCSLFAELMVQQSGVRTIAIGGLPSTGPMQPVGGTKGSRVLQSRYLAQISDYVIKKYASSTSEKRSWESFLPLDFGINVNAASVNFQDNIRKGLEADGIPTQFLNDTASCRLWYTPTMYLNASEVWDKVAQAAWGKDGKLDEGKCVQGSVTTKEQQQGQGQGNPTTTTQGSAKPSGSKAAAGVSRIMAGAEGGWTAILVCSAVVLGSMGIGARLI